MTTPRPRVLLLGVPEHRELLRPRSLAVLPGARVLEAETAAAFVPRAGAAFDVVLLALRDEEDPIAALRRVEARLPGVPVVLVGGDGRLDVGALVRHGVQDRVPWRCARCPNSPRLGSALRWAAERRALLERSEALRRECERLALSDALTGLANRRLLLDRLEHVLARRGSRAFALLYVDLDGFKAINDRLGHEVGDAVLVETARRLTGRLRAGDTCARWGGDEFLVLLEDVRDAHAPERVAADLRDRLREPLAVAGRELALTASIGISTHPRDGGEAEELIRRADAAMYAAKRRGAGGERSAGGPAAPGRFDAVRA